MNLGSLRTFLFGGGDPPPRDTGGTDDSASTPNPPPSSPAATPQPTPSTPNDVADDEDDVVASSTTHTVDWSESSDEDMPPLETMPSTPTSSSDCDEDDESAAGRRRYHFVVLHDIGKTGEEMRREMSSLVEYASTQSLPWTFQFPDAPWYVDLGASKRRASNRVRPTPDAADGDGVRGRSWFPTVVSHRGGVRADVNGTPLSSRTLKDANKLFRSWVRSATTVDQDESGQLVLMGHGEGAQFALECAHRNRQDDDMVGAVAGVVALGPSIRPEYGVPPPTVTTRSMTTTHPSPRTLDDDDHHHKSEMPVLVYANKKDRVVASGKSLKWSRCFSSLESVVATKSRRNHATPFDQNWDHGRTSDVLHWMTSRFK